MKLNFLVTLTISVATLFINSHVLNAGSKVKVKDDGGILNNIKDRLPSY